MKVDIRQRVFQIRQRDFVFSQFVVTRSQSAVRTSYLIPVAILLEKLEGTLGKSYDELFPRQVPTIGNAHHAGTFFKQEVVILSVGEQLRHRLRSIRLEVSISVFVAQHQAIHQIIELAQDHLFGRIGLIQTARSTHIIIV